MIARNTSMATHGASPEAHRQAARRYQVGIIKYRGVAAEEGNRVVFATWLVTTVPRAHHSGTPGTVYDAPDNSRRYTGAGARPAEAEPGRGRRSNASEGGVHR